MKISIDTQRVEKQAARFAAMESAVRGSLREAMSAFVVKAASSVKRNKLSGIPLKRVSGDLSRSVYGKTEGDGLTGVIGANTPYAARHEYGFSGTESVKSFVRRSRAQMTTAKFNKIGLETRPSKAKNKGAGVVNVAAHSRNVNYPARSFLRSTLEDMREEIIKTQYTAVMRGLNNAA